MGEESKSIDHSLHNAATTPRQRLWLYHIE